MTKAKLEKELRKANRTIRSRTTELIAAICSHADEVEQSNQMSVTATAAIDRARSVAEGWERTCKDWQKMYTELRERTESLPPVFLADVQPVNRWVN